MTIFIAQLFDVTTQTRLNNTFRNSTQYSESTTLFIQLCVCVYMSITFAAVAQSECTSGFSPVGNVQITENSLQYLRPETANGYGTQVIVPQMKFNCHGVITGWSALTVIPAVDPVFLQNFRHGIEFQVWRPKSEDDGGYTLVGSNLLSFTGLEVEVGPTPMDLNNATTGYFRFDFNKGGVNEENRVSFQPGDVVGWFTVAAFRTITPPLSVVFRNATSSDDPSLIVDMHSSLALNTPCETSTCEEAVNHHFSVIPYVSVNYCKYSN